MSLSSPQGRSYIGPWVFANIPANATQTLSFQQVGVLTTMAPTTDIIVTGMRAHLSGLTGALGTLTLRLGKNGVNAGAAFETVFNNQAVNPSFVGGLFAVPLIYTPSDLLGAIIVTDVAWNSLGGDIVVFITAQAA